MSEFPEKRTRLPADLTRLLKQCGYTIDDLRGPSRLSGFVEARRALCHKLRERGWSTPEIGAILNRHHTTIVNLLK